MIEIYQKLLEICQARFIEYVTIQSSFVERDLYFSGLFLFQIIETQFNWLKLKKGTCLAYRTEKSSQSGFRHRWTQGLKITRIQSTLPIVGLYFPLYSFHSWASPLLLLASQLPEVLGLHLFLSAILSKKKFLFPNSFLKSPRSDTDLPSMIHVPFLAKNMEDIECLCWDHIPIARTRG